MYYIIPSRNMIDENVAHFASADGIDLPDGSVLLNAKFHTPDRQERFEAHPQVTTLPHPMSGETVGEAVAAKLAHLGVTKDHRTWDVAKLAGKVHAGMKLR